MYPFEKKYKEAEERAKKALLKCRSLSEGQKQAVENALKEVFPDLTESESEDERIRKKLIGIFTNQSLCDVYNLKSKDVLAYLERQKEQKPTPNWMPSEEHLEALKYFVDKNQSTARAATGQWKEFTLLRELLNILVNLKFQ